MKRDQNNYRTNNNPRAWILTGGAFFQFRVFGKTAGSQSQELDFTNFAELTHSGMYTP